MKQPAASILCVDDCEEILNFYLELLLLDGYRVILSRNGTDALKTINRQKIDLILLDVNMPGLSGFDVCKTIKTDERYQNLPVMLVTGLTSREDRIQGFEAGADGFIKKPFDPSELLTRVKRLLNPDNSRAISISPIHNV